MRRIHTRIQKPLY